MDRLLVFGLALVAGAFVSIAPLPLLALAAGVLVISRQRRALFLVLAVGLLLGGWRARSSLQEFEAAESALDAELPRIAQCEGDATVETSPIVTRGTARFGAVLRDADCDGAHIRELHVTLYDDAVEGGAVSACRGDVLHVITHLAPPDRFVNLELGCSLPSRARRGVMRTGSVVSSRVISLARGPPAWIDRARASVRARILATFPEQTGPMARALVLGETDLSDADDEAFRQSGLAHLLAVSGTHLVLVVLGLVRLLRAILCRVNILAARLDVSRVGSALGVPIAWVYADFAGGSGSARRAAWMLSVGLLAVALGRRAHALRAFALSLVLAALVDPLIAFDVSFALSAAATAGLLAWSPALTKALSRRLPRPIASSLAATLSATLPCAPILATFAPTLPIGSALANLLAVPVGELAALPLCLAHALLSPWPDAERGIAVVASGALSIVLAIARASSSVGQVEIPRPTHVQLAALAFAFAASKSTLTPSRARVALLCACAALLLGEVEAIRRGQPRGVLRATFLDVAQGDATLIDLPDGSAMLVDGGGLVGSPVDVGQRVIAPVLRARRRDELALVVLSHPHPDHAGGLATGLDRVRVARAWDTGQGEREGVGGAYGAWLAKMRAQRVRVEGPGSLCGSHEIGGATLVVLAPCPAPDPTLSPNDNSFVILVRYGARSLLLVGDAEHEEERSLLTAGANLHADVLKVGHHGSRTSSTPEFIAAVRPSVAIISCGRRNRYGHPATGTLGALAGVRVFRTDLDGAVTVTTDGESLVSSSAVDGSPSTLYSPSP